ncbi:hypothetical protein CKAH01_08311 [Colletotrichum kahawae]|uniref:Uncharacterized protein n=1 Tax=Colletotrichum kahawae TaxID=34407 RepID=A0AAE0D0A1_COLKA|nr:hypothetical protein CKAH01_08311 [Colletotrichum kahawae]
MQIGLAPAGGRGVFEYIGTDATASTCTCVFVPVPCSCLSAVSSGCASLVSKEVAFREGTVTDQHRIDPPVRTNMEGKSAKTTKKALGWLTGCPSSLSSSSAGPQVTVQQHQQYPADADLTGLRGHFPASKQWEVLAANLIWPFGRMAGGLAGVVCRCRLGPSSLGVLESKDQARHGYSLIWSAGGRVDVGVVLVRPSSAVEV